jgi:hypothetical protein
MNADKIIERYVALRDRKAEVEAKHKEELMPLREQLELCEAALQKLMNDAGVKQLKGDHGTAFVKEQVSAKVTAWDDTLRYIQEQEAWDLLERRVNKTVVMEAEEEIPGVEISRRLTVNVRRT